MSYGVAAALQAAIYARLTGYAPLTLLVGTAIYDALPPGPLPVLYVVIGAETVRDRSDQTGRGADHEFTVSVVTDTAGFASAKAAAGAVSDALYNANLTLTRGSLVSLNFVRASAARTGTADQRQINLIFRARVADE